MSTAQERTLTVTVTEDQAPFLKEQGWYLHVAKTVVSSGKIDCNVAWQSIVPNSIMMVSWEPVYGFNWRATLTEGGGVSIVTEGDEWVQCDFGQALDLDATGKFVPGQGSGTPGLITVGDNNWPTSSQGEVNIMIGTKDMTDGTWKIIYVDPITIGLHNSASYQPLEEVWWWYDSEPLGLPNVPKHMSPIEKGNFGLLEDGFRKTSNFDPATGEWTTTNAQQTLIDDSGDKDTC